MKNIENIFLPYTLQGHKNADWFFLADCSFLHFAFVGIFIFVYASVHHCKQSVNLLILATLLFTIYYSVLVYKVYMVYTYKKINLYFVKKYFLKKLCKPVNLI